jgi:hypothetical protein
MSAVEATISVAGLWLACRLISVGLPDLLRASMPGVRLALACGLAVIAAKVFVTAAGIQGPLTLLIIAAPAAVVYCWQESSSALRMITDAFGRGPGPVNVIEESR